MLLGCGQPSPALPCNQLAGDCPARPRRTHHPHHELYRGKRKISGARQRMEKPRFFQFPRNLRVHFLDSLILIGYVEATDHLNSFE